MMIVRKAERSDLEEIFHLYGQLSPGDILPDPVYADKIWVDIRRSGNIEYFVAEVDGKIVSTCYAAVVPNFSRGGRPFAVIENVVTDEKFRRRGISRRVLNAAVDFAKEKNCYKVVLTSGKDRVDSHAFYEAVGFNGKSKRAFEIRLI